MNQPIIIKVSIPYRYTKNSPYSSESSSTVFSFNPLQVHKKRMRSLQCQFIVTSFNPLQVHKKHIEIQQFAYIFSSFNPLQVHKKRGLKRKEVFIMKVFQSPIGTQKTAGLPTTWGLSFLVSIPYRYTKNATPLDRQRGNWSCFNPLQVHKKLFQLLVRLEEGKVCFNPLQVHKKQQNEQTVKYPKTLRRQGF